ncbi:MAG TPA: NYN domain-containing protein [Nevskiaceae bacterium]|nr:NYN domain-containing protein [Nevskiaceae bacterium]
MSPTRLALLIDADNVDVSHAEAMFAAVARIGTPIIRRIYGNWASAKAARWKRWIPEHALLSIQQDGYVARKSAADIALTVDAMDLLHGRACEGFVLVSSDSDYTRLALRIREAGLTVHGIGEAKTPEGFRQACTAFVALDAASGKPRGKTAPAAISADPPKPARRRRRATPAAPAASPVLTPEPVPAPAPAKAARRSRSSGSAAAAAPPRKRWLTEVAAPRVRAAYEALLAREGEVRGSQLEAELIGAEPAFDLRAQGHQNLVSLIQALAEYEVTVIKGTSTRPRDHRIQRREA